MKNSNKYSGKKLRRPEIDKPFVKINSKLITCSDVTDAEFRLLCFLFSYSNGTTITVNNLSDKLHKKPRTILDIISSLVKKEVLHFTDTHIEVFGISNKPNCENPQCENLQNTECKNSQPIVQNPSLQPAENRSSSCGNPQFNSIDNTDTQNITDAYKNINSKIIIDKTISNNTSTSLGDNSSFSNTEEDDLIEIIPSDDTSKNTLPIEGVDFKPREELERITSKEGKTTWRLKNKPISKFLTEINIPKYIEIYNQWINLDITLHSKFSFAVFELVVSYMIVTCNPALIFYETNEELNRFVKIYSIDNIPPNLNGYLIQFIEDPEGMKKAIQSFRLPSDL